MRILISLLVIMLLGGQAQAAEFPEPPFEWVKQFRLNEIPGKASVYYDIDDDGIPDLVTAHDIVNVFSASKCPTPARRNKHIFVGSECSTRSPKVYVLAREIFAVRMVEEKWAIVTERTWRRCMSKNYVNLECRKEEENVILVPQGD